MHGASLFEEREEAINTNKVVATLHEIDDVLLTQSQLFDRKETQSGFQELKDQLVPGLGPCRRWNDLLIAEAYYGTQITGRIETEPYRASAKKREEEDQTQNKLDLVQTLLCAHERNCSHCRVFPQAIPFWSLKQQETHILV
jgi:hypothetical protein